MNDRELLDAAANLLQTCRQAGLTLAAVESCTGGLVTGALTAVSGSSDVMDRGFVTYTNEAKTELVGVPEALFETVGAVSEDVARAMATGGLERSRADIAVAVTGVAGPGASEFKPAGLVHVAAARRNGETVHERCTFQGDRAAVRRASVLKAFELILHLAGQERSSEEEDRASGRRVMSLRPRVAGVDFSGARNAGRLIWIAEGRTAGSGVEIERLVRANDLPGGATALKPALDALVAHVAKLTEHVIGFDFPFGLPRPLIQGANWEDFVANFAERYPDAPVFREACRAAAGGRELRRETDTCARVPWCVYNLRLFRQTWNGIRHVLRPLVENDRARAIPMQQPAAGKPLLAETCPASLLKRESIYLPYKKGGRSRDDRAGREDILQELEQRGMVRGLSRKLRRTILENRGGDALDAVIAAVAAARIAEHAPRNDYDRLEARIYF